MMRSWAGAVVMVGALVACSKSENAAPAPSASASTATSSRPAASAAPDAGTATATITAKTETGSFAGTYSVAPAKLYIPENKDWNGVKQAKDEPSKLVGDGALSLSVDASGRVSGTIDSGPAGPAVIEGSAIDSEIRGVVRRKDASDDGLTGTLVGTRSADGVSGKLSLAESNAAIVREGSFTLKKK